MADVLTADNPRAVVGDNMPPTTIDQAWNVYKDVSAFLETMPVIQSDEDAKSAKGYFDRAKVALDAMESDRDGQVRPLNETVSAINGSFKVAREPLTKLRDELTARMRAFAIAEEERRARILAEARRAAAVAEQTAREAEAVEAEAKANAAVGEFVDTGSAIAEADDAFREYKVADLAAARAARDSKVRLTGGTGRAFTLRTKETISIANPADALAAIIAGAGGALPDKIAEALISAARNYRTLMGSLPKGFAISHDRV